MHLYSVLAFQERQVFSIHMTYIHLLAAF